MIDYRWAIPILVALFVGYAFAEGTAQGVLALAFMNAAMLVLMFHRTQIDIHAKGVLGRTEEHEFEAWLQKRPELLEAVRVAHSLTPDDFMTFCSLLVEVRYYKDQKALELISRHFSREKK